MLAVDKEQLANATKWFEARGIKFFVWISGEYGIIVNEIQIEITENEAIHRAKLYVKEA